MSCSAIFNKKKTVIVSNLRFISRINFMTSWVEHEKSFITTWSECVKTMMYYATNAYDCTNECEEMYMTLQEKVTISKAQPSRGNGRRNVERSITRSIGLCCINRHTYKKCNRQITLKKLWKQILGDEAAYISLHLCFYNSFRRSLENTNMCSIPVRFSLSSLKHYSKPQVHVTLRKHAYSNT